MNLNITISDEQWKQLTGNIDVMSLISEDDIKKALKDTIIKSFEEEEFKKKIKRIILAEDRYYDRLTPQGEQMLTSCIDKEEFTDLKEFVINTLKEHSTEILVNSFAHIFLSGITNSAEFNSALQYAIDSSMQQIKNDLKNDLYTKCNIQL